MSIAVCSTIPNASPLIPSTPRVAIYIRGQIYEYRYIHIRRFESKEPGPLPYAQSSSDHTGRSEHHPEPVSLKDANKLQ